MKKSGFKKINPKADALKIASIYVLVSIIWIIVSDQILAITTNDTNFLFIMSSVKGVIFVILTTILIYLLIYTNLSSIKESDNRFLKAFNSSPVAIALIHLNGKIIDVNDEYLTLTGYKKKELYGKTTTELNITTSKTIKALIKEFKEKGRINDFKIEINIKSGEKRIVMATNEAITIDGENFNLNYLYDITHMEEVRKLLIESEEKYREIFNNTRDIISLVSLSKEGLPDKFLDINEVGIKKLGYSKEELLKMNPIEIMGSDETKESLEEAWEKRQKYQYELEGYNITKDGKQFPVEISSHIFKLKGEPVILAVTRDITQRKKSEQELKSSLKEKEALLREVHHRVNNNLQIITSLLNLQSSKLEDGKSRDILMTSQSRIKSMAMIHDKLYKSQDLDSINIKNYLKEYISDIFSLYEVDRNIINYQMDVEDLNLGIDTAIPLGLVINELLINIIKYAFPKGQKGNINIEFNLKDNIYTLIISDDGVGLPDNINPNNTETLGLQMANSLISQLEGTMEFSKDNGTKFKIIFKELKYKKRI
ncbi:MAG: PAS domain S-box protein [Methanobacteriaceae archaeon]|nr:PAS domain S-box protein [Methanobacteriaceae archaeon]